MKKRGKHNQKPEDKAVVEKLKGLEPQLKSDFGVEKIGIFGSYAREEEKTRNDIDLLVEFGKPVNLFEFSRLKRFLTHSLGIPVDLVTPGALKPLIKEHILKSVAYI